MKTEISALMDGELEDHELAGAFAALRRDEDVRRQWSDGHLIGAALRDEPRLGFDITAQVMAALEQEPTVLAPRPQSRNEWKRPALALAAAVSGVAVVAWLALAPGGDALGPAQIAQSQVRAVPVAARAATPRLQEYLVAHQAYAPSGPMVGGARNIRTVAVTSEGR